MNIISATAPSELAASTPAVAERRLTLLHVAAPAPVGGLERVLRSLALGQQAWGHYVHVLLVFDSVSTDHPIIEPLLAAGVGVSAIHVPTRAYWRECRVMRDLCAGIRPHVVHTHGFRPDVVDGAVVKWLGIPLVSTVHGFVRGSWRGRVYESLQRRAYRHFDAVAAVSRPQVEQLVDSGVPRQRVHFIPNAWAPFGELFTRVQARARLNIPANEFHVGWVGRLSREKGADVLLDAIARIPDLPIRVSIIGAGREEPALRDQARALGIESRVCWRGLLPEAGPLFSAFDAFVLSSRTEGTPIAIFEAMDARVPVIATRVGGVPDVVTPAHALLVESERPDELAAAIREVQQQPEAAETRTRAAADRLRRDFGAEAWVGRYNSLYHELTTRTVHSCS